VGDALGLPVEFMSLAAIKTEYGESGIIDYSPCYGRVGAISDDTQMTLFTAEGLLQMLGRNLPRDDAVSFLVNAYMQWLKTQGVTSQCEDATMDSWLLNIPELHARRAAGNTCLSALQSKKSIFDLYANNDSKGCGGLMRAAPAGLLIRAENQLESAEVAFGLGCVSARVTHGHSIGYKSAGAFASMINLLVMGSSITQAILVAKSFLKEDDEDDQVILRKLDEAIELANSDVAPTIAVELLGLGWVAEEALAIGVYACFKSRHSCGGSTHFCKSLWG
jgi:ADP-ribosylglycohydrolase